MPSLFKSRIVVSKAESRDGLYSRGYLPHFDGEKISQFITFRLFDSMPVRLIEKWKSELERMPNDQALIERFRRFEQCLDKGYGVCWLRDDRIAELVQSSLWHFHGTRYLLRSWCVMPNHVHALITLLGNCSLEKITHSWKSYTAHEANKILRRQGDFWIHESFDRYIRNETHFNRVVRYIERNPVKAGLCRNPEDWKWSSAYWRNQMPLLSRP